MTSSYALKEKNENSGLRDFRRRTEGEGGWGL